MPNFDLNALLQQVQNPAEGLPIIGVLVLLNVLFGVLVARKDGTFNRDYLLNFLESRILYQVFPVGAVGFGAIYLNMPIMSWVYVTLAVVLVGDLFVDLKEKMGRLFTLK